MAWIDVHVLKRDPFRTKMNRLTLAVTASTSVTYYCESDAATTLDEAIGAAVAGGTAVPAYNAAYSAGRPYCRVVGKTVEWVSKTIKHVIVDYEDPTDGSDWNTLITSAAKIGMSTEGFAKAYAVDAEDQQVVNTALTPFTNAPERMEGIKVYTIEKFVTNTVSAQIEAALYTNNDSPKTIKGRTWAADELWLADASFQEVDGTTKLKATIVIKGKKGGWKDVTLNVGYREITGQEIKVAADGSLDFIGGDAPGEPWPLGSDGLAYDPGVPPDELTFWPYERHAWTGVPLS